MTEVTTAQKISVTVVTALLIGWIMWVSWELYNAKAADKFNVAIMQLTVAIGKVNGSLNTEIERSKIKDEQGYGWNISQSGDIKELQKEVASIRGHVNAIHGN